MHQQRIYWFAIDYSMGWVLGRLYLEYITKLIGFESVFSKNRANLAVTGLLTESPMRMVGYSKSMLREDRLKPPRNIEMIPSKDQKFSSVIFKYAV